MKPQQPYQPAERDPVAIRRTVIILFLLMLVGGFFIVYKYKQKMGDEMTEVQKGRPAKTLGIIKTNFQVEGPEGKIYQDGFTFLENKVSLMTLISPELERESEVLINVLKEASDRYEGEERFQIVCISADPFSEVSADQLKAFCVEHGGGENWFYLTSKSEEFSKYVNKDLKLGDVTQKYKDSDKRVFPDVTRIVDYHMNLRGKQDDFYFVARSDAQAEFGKDNLLSEWQNYMYKNIDYILTEESADKEFSKTNNSNRYHFPLIVFGGFILFILIMGMRLKFQRKKEAITNRKNK
ncbi:MAG: hypothetical protein ACSHX6_00230 [Akkermansiaceae bacterium]